MPKAAVQLNAAVEVLPPEAIAQRLVQRVMFKSFGILNVNPDEPIFGIALDEGKRGGREPTTLNLPR